MRWAFLCKLRSISNFYYPRKGKKAIASFSRKNITSFAKIVNMTPALQLVVAVDDKFGIGKDGKLPWSVSEDLQYFKDLTSSAEQVGKQNAVIMGRKTYDSIPEKFRPLKNRLNVVLSRSAGNKNDENVQMQSNVIHASRDDKHQDNGANKQLQIPQKIQLTSILEAVEWLQTKQDVIENIFVIGGGEVYRQVLTDPQLLQFLQAIHLTIVEGDFECDTFLPEIDTEIFDVWTATSPKISRKKGQMEGIRYSYLVYTRRNSNNSESSSRFALPRATLPKHEEYQYLSLIKDIMTSGEYKGDRTGTGTIAQFGKQMRFNLRYKFPLLTTKRVFWRGVVEELLWFVRGSTNSKELEKVNVHIWDDNGSRQFLDANGFSDREEGDLGPVYGFQWRHYGAQYTDMKQDYSGQGLDQLEMVIDQIKNNPNSRRIILTAWNPVVIHQMALPPCHMTCQFYVCNGELSCQMYQRSCDMGLGVPFNIASYSLLTHMIAHVCDLRVGDFVHVLGDAHVYTNHIDALYQQLENQPRHFPELRIGRKVTNIQDFRFEDFELIGYKPHAKIQMKMAV
eukprot:TRINITY_DN4276_c0_g1_i1.p1 TRINITY_DN4276_c0_g1~~TRINITY_DN4276_c0_g1_i1.p1  ORF type:complete len:572 (-),score=34.43 TRINITY_DN4276_c0_g1_i1:540-2234(-)